jgi:hypothetical protein
MKWSILFVFIISCIVLLIICYILHGKVEKKVKADKPEKIKKLDKRCMNCSKKQYEDWFEIRCKNNKSEHFKSMVDDYWVCEQWHGLNNRKT